MSKSITLGVLKANNKNLEKAVRRMEKKRQAMLLAIEKRDTLLVRWNIAAENVRDLETNSKPPIE